MLQVGNYRVTVEVIDIGGVVYHGEYMKIYERMRAEHFPAFGLDFLTLWQQQLVFAVVEINARYLRPVFLETVKVATAITKIGGASIEVRHGIFDSAADQDAIHTSLLGAAELSARNVAVYQMAMVSMREKRAITIPDHLRQGINAAILKA